MANQQRQSEFRAPLPRPTEGRNSRARTGKSAHQPYRILKDTSSGLDAPRRRASPARPENDSLAPSVQDDQLNAPGLATRDSRKSYDSCEGSLPPGRIAANPAQPDGSRKHAWTAQTRTAEAVLSPLCSYALPSFDKSPSVPRPLHPIA